MNKVYQIEGMTCASCVQLIEDQSKKLKGINSVAVNFASEKAQIEFDAQFDPQNFVALLESLGYRAIDSDKVNANNRQSLHLHILRQGIANLIVGGIFMLMMFKMDWFYLDHQRLNLIQLVISFIILLFYSKFYLKNLYNFITSFHSNMHTLIGIGLYANIIYSIIIYFINPHAHLFVEGIPFILGFTKLGQYFDHIAKTKAQSSLSSLYKSQIKFANVIKDETISNLPVIELKANDVIRVKPGEKIPVNGIVLKGMSHVDESLISGESIPKVKEKDSEIIAGSVNLEGTLDIEVTKTFHDSTVASIIRFVEEAESKKTSLELMADKIVRLFVPVVIIISLITFVSWYVLTKDLNAAFSHFIAVLVIACPCALGLAAPICTMITTRKASENGLLINGGNVIEHGAKVDTVVFDKTGTLTEGKPVVEQILSFEEKNNESEYHKKLELVLGSCSLSTHPLSKAIVQNLMARDLKVIDPDKFKNIPGFGFTASIDEFNLHIGSRKYLENEKVLIKAELESSAIGSLVYVAINGIHEFTFIINDQIKDTAMPMLLKLKEANFKVWMLTGDNKIVSENIGKQLGIQNILSNVTPLDKANFIDQLKNEGHFVMMVGDGINDAIALSKANLSVAMAKGSDVAISAAQVSILDENLDLIYDFLIRSKKTLFLIKQNLFFSFIYNIFCIPLAAGLFVPYWNLDLDPKWASLSMGLSSVSVILNSLRLKKN